MCVFLLVVCDYGYVVVVVPDDDYVVFNESTCFFLTIIVI